MKRQGVIGKTKKFHGTLNRWSGNKVMKNSNRIFVCVILVISLFVVCFYTGIQNRNKCEATYIKASDGGIIGVSYKGRNYLGLDYLTSFGFFEYEDTLTYEGYPYDLIVCEDEPNSKNIYIEQDSFLGYIFRFDNYFSFFSERYDNGKDFVIVDFGYGLPEICVDENFVFPTIENNVVDEVWMSKSSSYEIIKDKETVNKIVKCAKSDGKIELDKEVYDYIKKYSADHHCLWLKYEDYPIVEEFQIEETEDGRYIVSQYDIEEYYKLSREDEAHQ